MSTEIVPFVFEGFDVRVLTVDSEPWFVAADVCAALGLEQVSRAMARLDDDQRASTQITGPNGRTLTANIVSEPGLYDPIIRSDKPQARPFRRWVTTEVLPSIRRTGRYETAEVPEQRLPKSYAEALRELASTVEERDAAWEQVAELEPAASAWHAMDDATGDYSVRQAAQLLDRDPAIGTGERRLFRYLREIDWIDKGNQPYQQHVDIGRVVTKTQPYRHPSTGETMLGRPQVRITHKGLTDLHRRLGGTAPLAIEATPGRAEVTS